MRIESRWGLPSAWAAAISSLANPADLFSIHVLWSGGDGDVGLFLGGACR